jgi:hypothetical protein
LYGPAKCSTRFNKPKSKIFLDEVFTDMKPKLTRMTRIKGLKDEKRKGWRDLVKKFQDERLDEIDKRRESPQKFTGLSIQ